MSVVTSYPLTDEILENYREVIKQDYDGYRNHVTRMLNFCHIMAPDLSEEQSKKLQIAGAFHDIGLWTHDRVDYLDPSVEECSKYLEDKGLNDWQQEIKIMIDMHHFIKAYQGPHQAMVELFRRADLVDFSMGAFKFGIDAATVKAVKQALPNAGFHKTLCKFVLKQLTRNPLNPFPMMRYSNKY